MITLQEIAEREHTVLFDSSASNLDNFIPKVYPTKRYEDLDVEYLIQCEKNLRDFLEFVLCPNTLTVDETVTNFVQLHKMVRDKQQFFNTQKRRLISRYSSNQDQSRILVVDISDTIFNILRILPRKIFKDGDRDEYKELYEYAKNVALHSSLPKLSVKNRQLCAAALYISLHKNNHVGVVTKSINFRTALETMTRNLLKYIHVSFQTINLELYPINIYLNIESGYKIIFSSKGT